MDKKQILYMDKRQIVHMGSRQDAKTEKPAKTLLGRLPKSTVINFVALCGLFLLIFLLHHFSSTFIDEPNTAPNESAISEITSLNQDSKEARAPKLELSKNDIIVEDVTPKAVSAKELLEKKTTLPKIQDNQLILEAKNDKFNKVDIIRLDEVENPEGQNIPEVDAPETKLSEKIVSVETKAEIKTKQSKTAKRTRTIPRAVDVGPSVEELDGAHARQEYLDQTAKYIGEPVQTELQVDELDGAHARQAYLAQTAKYIGEPVRTDTTLTATTEFHRAQPSAVTYSPPPTYPNQDIYIPFEKKDR